LAQRLESEKKDLNRMLKASEEADEVTRTEAVDRIASSLEELPVLTTRLVIVSMKIAPKTHRSAMPALEKRASNASSVSTTSPAMTPIQDAPATLLCVWQTWASRAASAFHVSTLTGKSP